MSKTAREEAARILLIEQNACPQAFGARVCMEQMPPTHTNMAMCLDAYIVEAKAISWHDDSGAYDSFIGHLEAASAALDCVYARKEIDK